MLEDSSGTGDRAESTEIMTDLQQVPANLSLAFLAAGIPVFSPRPADAGASVFWRMDHDADCGVLNDIARGQSDPENSPSVGRNDPDRWLPA